MHAWPLFMIEFGMQPGDRGREVGVVEDDRRRLAAELERAALELLAAERADALPAAVEPVKLILSMSGWRTRCSPTSRPGGHDVDHTRRAARPPRRISARRYASSGVSGAGFSTTVEPDASAGPELQHDR